MIILFVAIISAIIVYLMRGIDIKKSFKEVNVKLSLIESFKLLFKLTPMLWRSTAQRHIFLHDFDTKIRIIANVYKNTKYKDWNVVINEAALIQTKMR